MEIFVIDPKKKLDPKHVLQHIILKNRIVELIPDYPEILSMDDPKDLFEIKPLKTDDLKLMNFEVYTALQQAKHEDE